MEVARAENWFPRWSGRDAVGKESKPLEILILGSLRSLGRGFTFDDCKECTAISEEVHRCFFREFIKVGSTILFDKHVRTPTATKELASHPTEFHMVGMARALASIDATHIIHEMCA